ncbi:MAG: acyl carrier protein phosphodiesterase [Gammaproteobacteria bacterium]
MNYFAHLYLSQPTVASTVGNLLGDFAKGVVVGDLPQAVLVGLHNHRAVDRFTDTHPVVKDLIQLFSQRRRRFGGIALDVYFDHLLMKHWSRFDERPLDEAIETCYRRMQLGQDLMPSAHMVTTTSKIVSYDWFGSYRDIQSVAMALDRIAARIRFGNHFEHAIEEIEQHQNVIEQGFLEFFPQLVRHVQLLELEITR